MKKIIDEYLEQQIKCIQDIKSTLGNTIVEIYETLISAREKNGKIFLMGNGGSASTASHFTADLLKTSLTRDTKRFKAISLTDNIPVLLAWANDTSYENVFKAQLENFLEKNDIVIGISGSGNSPNVLRAVEYANSVGAKTISLTGKDGGKLSKISKISLIVPNNDMLSIETIHLMICHLLTTMIRSSGEPLFSY